jgi:hypothetical protein
MPTDLLSLALAAVMPLAAFALYFGVRGLRDQRTHRRIRSRPAARATTVVATAPPTPTRTAARTEPVAVHSSDATPDAPPALAEPVMASPTPAVTLEPSILRRVDPPAAASRAAAAFEPRMAPLSTNTPVAASSAPAPSGPRAGGRPRTAPFSSIRSLLHRESGRAPETPTWPDPAEREPVPVVGSADADPGPCPFCEESRLRGAWFCRRCRRPVDPRAVAAIARVSRSVRPAAGSPGALAGIPAVPAQPDRPAPLTLVASLDPAEDEGLAATFLRPAAGQPADAGAVGRRPETIARPLISRVSVSRPMAAASGSDAAAAAGDPSEGQTTPADLPASGEGTVPRDVVRPAAVVSAGRRSRRPKAEPQRPLVAVGPGRPDAPAEPRRTAGSRRNGHVPKPPRLDLNRATVGELVALKGVGRATAVRIVSAREDAPFASVDALLERRLLGRSVLDGVRDQVTV